MRIIDVASTQLFAGEPDDPRQIVRVIVEPSPGPFRIRINGDGVDGEARGAGDKPVEVAVRATAGPGAVVPIEVTAEARTERDTARASLVVAEPGWTVWMVPHFHYDPVWWNTQAAYTATWGAPGQTGTEFRMDFQHAGLDLVRLHLETARRDPDYKFVLAELDYLKPYWDAHPQDRAYLRALLRQGRVELVGGTYNEPNTNLTSAESTIRNLVHGIGFQRDVLGGDPRSAWQLDVFGHDPQFPGLVAEAGLDSSSWARGPFHQWGPMLGTHAPGPDGWGDPSTMQFPSEFEWLSPSGSGVLTHYMPAHYSAGWQIDSQPTLAAAEHSVYALFLLLKQVAATRNVLLPVGTDYTPPAKWVTEIHRDWNARYLWPRLVCGLPREFFAAVRAELDRTGRRPSPQTRDMNPVYTGKDVSYVDTKQAQRHAETLLTDAEMFATIAATHGAPYPHTAVDKAWRQLVFGAHHDAITGSESDQVYLDLLTGWREAYDLAGRVLDESLNWLCGRLPGSARNGQSRVVVFNPSAWARTDLVRARVHFPDPGTHGVILHADDSGAALPVLLDHARRHSDGSLAAVDVVFRAHDVPSVGYRTWLLSGTPEPSPVGWRPVTGDPSIDNGIYRVAVDPARGGAVHDLTDLRADRQLLRSGQVGNELLVYDEYPAHPRFQEGPWHLLPKGGPAHGSSGRPAESVQVEHSPLGQRITVTGSVGPARYTQQLTLWYGIDRLDATTHLDEFTGADQLIRLRWPVDIPGALPVSEVGDAVVGRGFALIDVDSAEAPWTLDNPAHNWFAVSSTARVRVHDLTGTHRHTRAIGVAEIIAPDATPGHAVRELAVALVRQGVTATCSTSAGPRYGRLDVDSNLPDVRISIGGPDTNAFTAQVLAAADPGYTAELERQLDTHGHARIWIPADRPLAGVWVPNADLTAPRTLPVLIVVGNEELDRLRTDLDAGLGVVVAAPEALCDTPDPEFDDHTVAIANRGIPGFAVDASGALHLSLVRSCTGWPSGVWIDPPRRAAPDGSTFQQQHWTHTFEYALIAGAGDWRRAGLVRAGHEVNHPLLARIVDAGPAVAESLVRVEPAGQAVLAALKPAGNPLASGRTPQPRVDRVTARLYEATGQPATVQIRPPVPLRDAVEADLLERPTGEPIPIDDDGVRVTLPGAGIRQYVLALASPGGGRTDAAEPHQPVYARYWLHNTGPAPAGNLPVTLSINPTHRSVSGPATLTVTVASDLTEEPAGGDVRLVVPAGWRAEPPSLRYDLKPGEYLESQVVVTPAPGAADGVYWVRARLTHDGQSIEDVARLLVGAEGPETVRVRVRPLELRLRPGESGAIDLSLASDAATPISAQVHLISPWHTWDIFPQVNTGTEVPARGEARLTLPVRIPVGHRPGRWWALVRVAHAGQLHYTEHIRVEVLP